MDGGTLWRWMGRHHPPGREMRKGQLWEARAKAKAYSTEESGHRGKRRGKLSILEVE